MFSLILFLGSIQQQIRSNFYKWYLKASKILVNLSFPFVVYLLRAHPFFFCLRVEECICLSRDYLVIANVVNSLVKL